MNNTIIGVLVIILTIFSCKPKELSLREMATIAEKDLGIKHYGIRYADHKEIAQMCYQTKGALSGCTSNQITLINRSLQGCQRVVTVFHEMMHQHQFINGLVLDEETANEYSLKMARMYCK